MSQQPLRSRMFAGVAALSGVGASLAVNGAGFVALSDAPAPVSGARSKIDPNRPLKRRAVDALAMTHDPYSHLVRLAGLYPEAAGSGGDKAAVSLSLESAWTALAGVTNGADGVERPDERFPMPTGLDPRLMNLTFVVDAQYGAPRWGN